MNMIVLMSAEYIRSVSFFQYENDCKYMFILCAFFSDFCINVEVSEQYCGFLPNIHVS